MGFRHLKEYRVENGVSVYDQTEPKPGSILKSMTLVKAKAKSVPNVERPTEIYMSILPWSARLPRPLYILLSGRSVALCRSAELQDRVDRLIRRWCQA